MISPRPAQSEIRFPNLESDFNSTADAVSIAIEASRAAGPDPQKARGRQWRESIAALSIAMLVAALYASVCFHWGGPRVTLLILSLAVTGWLYAVQRPWEYKG